MNNDITPRSNITDYIIETAEGSHVLLQNPVDWQEGETMRKATGPTKGIDIKALCALLCEDGDIETITYSQLYKICEVVLQMQESGHNLFPE